MEELLMTLGILFFFALIGGILAVRFKQPILLGLLLVGALIGPNMLGLIHNEVMMDAMIEFGAILVLFVLGLEFDIPRLKKLGLKPVILASLNVALMTFSGFVVSIFLGFSVPAALFLGVILSFGSTVVIANVLEHKGMMDREEVPLLIAVLIIDDIIAVLIVTFLSGIENKSAGLMGSIELLITSVVTLVLVYVIFVKFLKPGLSYILEKNNSEEIKTFTALALWIGFAYLAYYLKLSPAVGAFMAGSIVASLPNINNLKKTIDSYNLITSAFFFIAIGTLINFAAIRDNIMIILILVTIVIIMKLTAYSAMTYLFANLKGDKMFFLSIATFSVGEFSLLIAKESTKFNIGIDLISIAASVVAISAVIMSMTINYSDRVYEPTKDWIPYKMRQKVEKFAEYIKAITEEMDLDNKYSRGLKNNIASAFIAVITVLMIIFGWKKLAGMMIYGTLSQYVYLLWPGYLAILAFITVSLFYTLFKSQKIIKTLADIFGNATNNRSHYHSKITVKRAFFSFGMFWLALLWPFVMFLLALQAVYLTASFIMLALSVWQFHKISASMEDHVAITREQFPQYKKFDYKPTETATKSINSGWKI